MPDNILKISDGMTFNEAIELLDGNGNGVLPVVDDKGEVYGIITDGDIRKAIIKNSLNLESVINRSPKLLNVNSTHSERVQFLKSIKRRHVPLVDNDNKFIRIFTLDEVEFNTQSNWVVIMAGGLGSRLGELTKDTPKPMLKVKGKPILEKIIENFKEQGFINFYLAVNYKKEVIKEYFKSGDGHGVNIRYLEENCRLGTAGALSLIEEQMEEPLIVINGDVLSAIDYKDMLQFHIKNQSVATMCVKEYEHVVPYGVIETDDARITGLSEKPRIAFNINSGIYVISPQILGYIPQSSFYDMPTLFSDLVREEQVTTAYKSMGYWIDLGRPDDLVQANEE
ncbi:nucleotidyltransferase family protein [Pseudoalteromonas sp. DY56-GL79]|uniref:nucleotidyltransferase family protein n=1 Tax=Pseudoalteromonas sp. DY56-GL79 TaxID=2967131 RepID=UPI00352AE888